jgi:hypothetical protein
LPGGGAAFVVEAHGSHAGTPQEMESIGQSLEAACERGCLHAQGRRVRQVHEARAAPMREPDVGRGGHRSEGGRLGAQGQPAISPETGAAIHQAASTKRRVVDDHLVCNSGFERQGATGNSGCEESPGQQGIIPSGREVIPGTGNPTPESHPARPAAKLLPSSGCPLNSGIELPVPGIRKF